MRRRGDGASACPGPCDWRTRVERVSGGRRSSGSTSSSSCPAASLVHDCPQSSMATPGSTSAPLSLLAATAAVDFLQLFGLTFLFPSTRVWPRVMPCLAHNRNKIGTKRATRAG